MNFLTVGIKSTISIGSSLWGVIRSENMISTLLVILIIALKLFINNNATSIQKKVLVVSIPGELTVLVVGFLISTITSKNQNNDYIGLVSLVLISLILLVWLYASERTLENRLSGSWNWGIWVRIVFMFLFAGALYIIVVFGGIIS